jgi:hypothetical protein
LSDKSNSLLIRYLLSNIPQRYQRRQKKAPLGSVSELPEDAERQNFDATGRCDIASDDRGQQQLTPAFRVTVPDAVGSHSNYDGIIRPQDISRFSYDSLLNPALAELHGSAAESFIRRRRLANLGIVSGFGGYDEDDWTDCRVHPASKAVQHLDAVASEYDLRHSKRRHHLPRLTFSPESRLAETASYNGGLWLSPLDDDWRSICFGSARSYRSASVADADDAEDGRSSTTSSLSDVSALQRIYGPRFSAASRLTLTSGRSIRSALRGIAGDNEDRHLMSRNSTAGAGCGSNINSGASTPQRSHETGRSKLFAEFQQLEIDQAQDANILHPEGGSGETAGDATTQATARRSSSVAAFQKKKKKKKNRNCVFVRGEISRAFVYSYFTLLPGIGRGKAEQEKERQKPGIRRPTTDSTNQTTENGELLPSNK